MREVSDISIEVIKAFGLFFARVDGLSTDAATGFQNAASSRIIGVGVQ